MIDWTSIINTLIVAVFGGGGIMGLATIREKKQGQFLDNVTKLLDNWQELAEERKGRAQELKTDLDKKDHKIDTLYTEKEAIREELDHCRTENAISKLLKCNRTECTERMPPFGQGYNFITNKKCKCDENIRKGNGADKTVREVKPESL